MDDVRGRKEQGLFWKVIPATMDLRRKGNDGPKGFIGAQCRHGRRLELAGQLRDTFQYQGVPLKASRGNLALQLGQSAFQVTIRCDHRVSASAVS